MIAPDRDDDPSFGPKATELPALAVQFRRWAATPKPACSSLEETP